MQILNTSMSKIWNDETEWGFEEGCLLLGAKEMYEATGEESYFSFIKEHVKNAEKEDGRIFFFLYDKTKEEKYRQAIESVMGKLHGLPDLVTMEDLYKTLPFYMEYETKYGKKEKYSDIVKKIEEAERELSSGERKKGDILWYLFTLIDVIDNMSIEIYEQYRKLQDIFKHILKEVLKETGCGSILSPSERAIMAYCILKACNIGIVLTEKYMDFGMDMVKRLREEEYDTSGDGKKAGMFFMAYGQYLKLQKGIGGCHGQN